ncbi:MAG: ABC transporter ATP-binding protein [Pseudomonadales bacterium]|nr:ABC transporter ATP-binding protein [Pseudomonadales bacterium]
MNRTASQLDEASPSIKVHDLRHIYKGGHVALDGVNLTCGTGVYGLLGPNGAGKSTLMRILCTLIRPTEGSVELCGFDVTKQQREVRSLLGYLPQDFGGWRSHRVIEVVDTLAQLSGLFARKVRRARVEQVIEEVGLVDVAYRKVKQLSGGMVRRLGVAQALVHEPRILVVDEPTVGLDPEERIRFRKLMEEIGRDRTILLSTHIVADLGAACREISILDTGRTVFSGSPAELFRSSVGAVFELITSVEKAELAEQNHEVVSRISAGGQVTLRAIASENGMPPGATRVDETTLEESYMAFMSARGRATVARQEGELHDVSSVMGTDEREIEEAVS